MLLEALALAACLAVIAWVSAAETACFSLSRIEVRRLSEASARGALLARLLSDPAQLLSTILIVNTIAAVGASTAAVALLERIPGLSHTALVFGDAVLTSLALLVLGDITPKTLAVHHAESMALALAPFIAFVEAIVRPFSQALGALARRVGGVAEGAHRRGHRPEDLIATIEAGRDEGILGHAERELLLGTLTFGRRTVQEVMRPWARVLTIPVGTSAAAALDRLAARRVSRAPLVSPTGEVQGVVRAQDLLALVRSGKSEHAAGEAARLAFFVAPDTTLDMALRTVRHDRTYVLIVGNDARHPLGLVALRDLVEELIAGSRATRSRRGRARPQAKVPA
jgi:CBS domain containing-hemolysin-like protein